MNTYFSYCPRSGTRISHWAPSPYMVKCHHGNGSLTFIGNFSTLTVNGCGNIPRSGSDYDRLPYLRGRLVDFGQQWISSQGFGGFVEDSQGVITFGIPNAVFRQFVLDLMRWIPPLRYGREHYDEILPQLFMQGLVTIDAPHPNNIKFAFDQLYNIKAKNDTWKVDDVYAHDIMGMRNYFVQVYEVKDNELQIPTKFESKLGIWLCNDNHEETRISEPEPVEEAKEPTETAVVE